MDNLIQLYIGLSMFSGMVATYLVLFDGGKDKPGNALEAVAVLCFLAVWPITMLFVAYNKLPK